MTTEEPPILICHDGSPDAERVVDAAAALLGPRRAVVLDVAPSMTFAEGFATTSSVVPGNAFEELNGAEALRRRPRAATGADRAAGPDGLTGARMQRHLARARWMVASAVLVAAIAVAAVAAGWDVRGWLGASWAAFTAVSLVYVVPALALQTLGVLLAGAAWHGILRYAYPDGDLSLLGVLACYATGIALNGFLPGNAGSLVTVLMLVAAIAAATPAGVLATAGVEKLFFSIVGALVWVYLFVSVGGSFQRRFGFASAHPWATALALAAICLVLAVVVRLAWRRLRKLWEQVKQGGRILSQPRAYVRRVLLLQLLAWCSRLGFVAVVLAAYAIPVSFHTVLSVAAGNTLANVVSFTPGGIGVSQAFNVASLHGAASAAAATASSIGQQLLATAWNVVVAAVLLAIAFGPSGARRLLRSSYLGAKAKRDERDAPLAEA